ncbi:MAG: transketolase [Pseudomonadales bacterium]|nr:transketolase [Pseudomonadales bacterium]MCP5183404.1 transketolase [Pseudomonadales bacterium]
MDAVEKAKSGHPGAPMGMADIAEVLWVDFLKHDPAAPDWWDRDRFVLSNGHASMLLYSLLHLTGYAVSMDDIKNFRQLGSPTAGHPEVHECPGVETTTGPLGQGFANAVGMALAESKLAAAFNRDGHTVVDHRTWVFAGDGCLMEGVSHEAAALAGALGLGKLICIYDQNGISIDGAVDAWFPEDVAARFEAYGWRVIRDVQGHEADKVEAALKAAMAGDGRPTLVMCRTVIGYGAPGKQGTAGVHGSPLGAATIAAVRTAFNWGNAPFDIPGHIYEAMDCRPRGGAAHADWTTRFDAYRRAHPQLAAEFERRMRGDLPEDWDASLTALINKELDTPESLATRVSSQRCIAAIAEDLPELFGGSADLSESNGTHWKDAGDRYLSYGVREFGMTAITNGLVLHGGLRPFSGTFLVFMEYARNAVRLAALMHLNNILVYTHDSVALGEDGPTHQPIEQLTNLRTTPNLRTWRPCDTVETAVAWREAIRARRSPSALVLTRQKTPPQAHSPATLEGIARGGYVLSDPQGVDPVVAIIATGSEVGLALQAANSLTADGVPARVISMPCAELFLAQDAGWRDAVLPPALRARVAVEAAHPGYWYRFVGLDGEVVGIERFGLSAPGDQAMAACGITTEAVVNAVRRTLSRLA